MRLFQKITILYHMTFSQSEQVDFAVFPVSSDIQVPRHDGKKHQDLPHRDIAANEVDYLNVEDPDVFSHRAWELKYQREQEIRRNQPARTKKKSYDIAL